MSNVEVKNDVSSPLGDGEGSKESGFSPTVVGEQVGI